MREPEESFMFAFILALQSEGLTLHEIVSDIPHDAGSGVAYLLIGSIVFLCWFGSRRSVIDRYSSAPAAADAIDRLGDLLDDGEERADGGVAEWAAAPRARPLPTRRADRGAEADPAVAS
jgi:hypothetical protein